MKSGKIFALFLMISFLSTGCSVPSDPLTSDNIDDNMEVAYKRAESFLSFNKPDFITNDTVSPNWLADGTGFWYRRSLADNEHEFVRVDVETGNRTPAFDQQFITDEIFRLIKQKTSPGKLPFSTFDYNSSGGIDFQIGDTLFECNAAECVSRENTNMQENAGEVRSSDGSNAIFFRENNLWVRTDKGESPLTSDGEKNNTYGISVGTDLSTITRKRMGVIDKPLVSFSPNGRFLFTQKIDQRTVEPLHFLEKAPREGSQRPKLHSVPYAFARDEHKPIGQYIVIDIETGEMIEIDLPPTPVLYVPNLHPLRSGEVKWSDDGQYVYFIRRYEFGTGYEIIRAEAKTGKTEILATRKSERVSGPSLSIASPGLLHLIGAEGIVWFSDEDGWGHLYYSSHDGKKRQLTSGSWNVINVLHINQDRREIYFLRTLSEEEGNPYHRIISRLSIDEGTFVTLTPEHGHRTTTNLDFSPTGDVFLDTYSNGDVPGKSVLRDHDGHSISVIETADLRSTTGQEVSLPEVFSVTAADGNTTLWGKILRPSNFDPDKKYPVVDAIYPGPQINRVNYGFSGRGTGFFDSFGEPQALAELGFIVIIMDGRGTPMRSRDFHYPISPSLLGEAGFLSDHVTAIKDLATTRPWMDLDRVGIYGHSGGGYAAARAIMKYPDFFKVAVSSAGNHDQRIYLPVWGESYLGRDNGENYRLASNSELAGNLEGELLLIVGDLDDNVHPAATYQLVEALIKENKDFHLLSLPNGNHAYTVKSAPEYAYVTRRTWDFFVDHLSGAKPPRNYKIRSHLRSAW